MKENNGFKMSIDLKMVIALIISMIIVYVSVAVPGAGELSILLPVTLGYILIREGAIWFITAFIWTGVFAVTMGVNIWTVAMFIFILAMAPAIQMVFGIRNRIFASSPEEAILITIENEITSPWKGVLIFCLAAGIGIIGISVFAQSVTGTGIQSYYDASIDSMIAITKSEIERQKATLPADSPNLSYINETMANLESDFSNSKGFLPSVIFVMSLMYGFIIYFIARRVYRAAGLNVPRNARLAELWFPQNTMNAVLGILIVFFIAKWTGFIQDESAFVNIIFMLFTIFAFLGAGAVIRVLSKLSFGKIIAYISVFLLTIFTGPMLLGVIGIIASVKRSIDTGINV